MRITGFLIGCCLISFHLSGQVKEKATEDYNNNFVLTWGLSYQAVPLAEIGLFYAKSINGNGMFRELYYGPKLTTEITYFNYSVVMGPKISYELNTYFLAYRLGIVYYTDLNSTKEIRLIPEIGININGWVNVMYGYSFPFSELKFDRFSNSKISLTVNFKNEK